MNIIKSENILVAFVNSEEPPQRVERLKIYTYSGDDANSFFELCKYYYVDDLVNHSLYTWEQIYVPIHKRKTLTLICDAMAEF